MKIRASALGSFGSLAALLVLPHLALAQTLGTPGDITATVESCNGKYLVNWSAVSGATTYDIYVQWPGSSSFVLLKAVVNTMTTLTPEDASLDTNFEIEACNSSGCGAPGGPFALPWYSGCP